MQYRTTYSIEKTTADLLIFGASRANHDYHPEIFQDRLKMSYYNVGRDGQFIFYNYAVLKGILKRYSPKMVIYDFDVHEFKKDQESYDRLSSLLPYYYKHSEIRSIIELKNPYEKLKLLSNIYPYNSSIFSICVGNAEFNKKRWKDINGYVPLTNIWTDSIKEDNPLLNYEIDSNKVNIFESFIRDCLKTKIELYIVYSPVFNRLKYVSNSTILGKTIANKYNVRSFDFSRDSTILSNSQLFADIGHLNNEGAKIFSHKVIDSIAGFRSLIKK